MYYASEISIKRFAGLCFETCLGGLLGAIFAEDAEASTEPPSGGLALIQALQPGPPKYVE